jgi:hypothetical protein
MISATQCAALAGLKPDDLILGVCVSSKHRSLLSTYLLNLHRGHMAVKDMIVADLRRFRELGAFACAADLLVVLRLFLMIHPEARCARICEVRDDNKPIETTKETNVIEFAGWSRTRRFGKIVAERPNAELLTERPAKTSSRFGLLTGQEQ